MIADMLIKLMKKKYNIHFKSKWLIICLTALIAVMFIPASEVKADSGLKLYYYATKKETNYTDKQVKVTFNGKQISKNDTPGILVNGYSLVPYKDIFENSAIKAECVYDKTKGTISISKYGTTIVMTLDSKNAFVNGKAVTLPVAPFKVKYVKAGVDKILVPSRFISETIGLGYTWNSTTCTVAIVKEANSLILSYNNGNKFTYTGARGAVTIDGKKVNLGNMPSIITNNTAMLRAKRVFQDSKIGAKYSYNKADKTITLSKDSNTLVMRVGSPVAYLNGKAIVLDTAPILVHNYEVNTSYVMVPGSFTASCLGYDYAWDNASRTSVITSRKNSEVSEKPEKQPDNNNPPVELGDSSVINDGRVIHEWNAAGSPDKSSGITSLNLNSPVPAPNGFVLNVSRDYNRTSSNSETYMIIGSVPFGMVTSEKSGQSIKLTASGMSSMDYTYQVFGSSGSLVNTVKTTCMPAEWNTVIDFSIIPTSYTYDISLSENGQIIFLTVYINSLRSIKIGTGSSGDYITLTGVDPLNAFVREENGLVFIELNHTFNGVGDITYAQTEAKYIGMINAAGLNDRTQLVLVVSQGYTLYISENENQYTLHFNSEASQGNGSGNGAGNDSGNNKGNTGNTGNTGNAGDGQSDGGQDAQTPPAENLPEITDKDKYEIIIPKPAGITRSQISDNDDYYNNRFSIMLPGDYTGYINDLGITCRTGDVTDITVFCNGNGQTEIIVSACKLLGYEIAVDNNYIYVNTGNPREIYKNIVVLDPGHGGPANGANYNGTREKDLNYKMLYELGKKYFKSDSSVMKVYYTRETDVDIALKDRAAFAEKVGADLFVSLHMNASLTASVSGTEVYYSNNNNKTNSAGLNSSTMATLFVNNLSAGLGTGNRGSRAERYTVVHNNTVPAVLIELGFMSNTNDYNRLIDPVFQEDAVRIIYDTLIQIFHLYPTGR
jgi:N-acetylmuramoyl-L-alanine amidase